MKAIVWNGEELGAKFDEVDIPADLVEQANEYREKLIDAVVEQDDQVSLAGVALRGGGREGAFCSLGRGGGVKGNCVSKIHPERPHMR